MAEFVPKLKYTYISSENESKLENINLQFKILKIPKKYMYLIAQSIHMKFEYVNQVHIMVNS